MNASKPSMLIFIEHYLPGYKFGGPIRSVAGLVTLLKPHYAIYVVTRDRDEGDLQPYGGITVGQWTDNDGYQLIYLPPNRLTLSVVNCLLAERTYDFVYTNSLFSHFTRLLLLTTAFRKRQLTIAPRGELHEGAIRLKAYKKRPYVAVVRWLAADRITWHATDQQEIAAVQRTFTKSRDTCVPVRLAPDVPSRSEQRTCWQKTPGQLRLLSIARIARNKGLKFLLECLPAIANGQIALDIHGPIVDVSYWKECQQLIAAMPPNCRVTYQGELNHAQVGETMQQYHFLAMPTHGENFGHVIFEALSAGLPVLISDQTPWRQLAPLRAGWDLPLQLPVWVETMQTCLAMDQDAYSSWVEHAVKTAVNYLDTQRFEQSYLDLFVR